MSSIPPFNLKFLANRIDISGGIHAGQGSIRTDFEVGNDLTVKKDLTTEGKLSANAEFDVAKLSTFNGDVSMNGHLVGKDASFNNITVENTIYMGQALEVGTVKVVHDISCSKLDTNQVFSKDGSFNKINLVDLSGNNMDFTGDGTIQNLEVKGILKNETLQNTLASFEQRLQQLEYN